MHGITNERLMRARIDDAMDRKKPSKYENG
jgi:hypothetical protein